MSDRRRTPPPRRPAGSAPARPPASGRSSRPAAGARNDRRALGQVDGPRGQRDGTDVVARRSARARRRLVGAVTATVVALAVMLLAALPVKTYLQQRSDTKKAEAALAEVQAERRRIARETARLATPEAIEERAREELGFHRPDEETYNVLPGPAEPLGLPDAWPFTGVERALGSR